jgi:Ca2+-transporting ATPase
LTSNGGELFVVLRSLLIAGIWWLPLAISPLLILCIDLIGEMWPLMALTNDPPQHNIMKEKPRNIHDHIINQHTIFDLIGAWFVMGTLSYLSFIVKLWFDGMIMVSLDADSDYYATAKTLTYVTILMIQYVNILWRRPGYQSIFTSYLFTNRILRISFALSWMFILLIVYQPYINQLVWSWPLWRSDWLIAIIAAFIYGAYREGIKYYYRTKGYHA